VNYKGYIGRVTFDEEAKIFHGEVINTKDVITFQGESVQELEQAFHDSVDDYLDFCMERNEAPDKPFSGKFVVRVPAQLHRKLYLKAASRNMSLNKYIVKSLSETVAERK